VTVLIADNNEVFRQNLLQELTGAMGIHVVGLADTVQEATTLTQVLHPDVILLSVALLGSNGVVGSDAGLFTDGKVLILSEPGQEERTLQTLQLGARGFLIKDIGLLPKLPDAIRSVQRGDAILSPRLTGWMLDTLLH
jgi:DNA-binding NarL/FixJ family response regulator